jgi:predicted nucleotidyltransferase
MAVAATARDWETVFTTWSAGPRTTEQEKAENAERATKKAICASSNLSTKDIRVFPQGSYRNRTNVRQESDVDICVCLRSPFITEYSGGLTDADLGFELSSYTPAAFKNDVEKALKDYFGGGAITRGTKAFDVHHNTYRIDADVVPTLEYHWYHKYADNSVGHIVGTALFPDGGSRIENYPEQNYENGVKKNDDTSRLYKRTVRILKRLRNEMADKRIASAKTTPSYLIECLVWQVPNDRLNRSTYRDIIQSVLSFLWGGMKNADACKEWCEVNDIKYLFRPSQPWTREQAYGFINDAWDYVGVDVS